MTSQSYASSTDVATNTADIDAIEVDYLTSASLSGYATQAWVSAQGYSTFTDLMSYVSVDTVNDTVTFSGANVYIQSGSGYDSGSASNKTGAHNLVIGDGHTYTSYGGMVVGFTNTVSSPYAAVAGGASNTAKASYALVAGGSSNTASGSYSVAVGGASSTVTANYAASFGGQTNTVGATYASVLGGYEHTVNSTATHSVIVGGNANTTAVTYDIVP